MNEGLRFDPSNVLHEPQGSWERDELQEDEDFPADDDKNADQAPTNPYLDATRGNDFNKPDGDVEGNPDEEAPPEEEDGPRSVTCSIPFPLAPSTCLLPRYCHPSRARPAAPPATT